MQQQFHRSSRSAFLLLFLKRTSPSVPCSYRQDGKAAKDVNCLVPWQWTALWSSTLLFRDCQGCPDVSALNSVAQHLCWNWQARVFASWLGLKAFESAMSGKHCHRPQTREPCRVHTWGKTLLLIFSWLFCGIVHLLKLPVTNTVNALLFLAVVTHECGAEWEKEWSWQTAY